ncbi:hypothetical protein V2J09_012835 [Rumex salicifolius]
MRNPIPPAAVQVVLVAVVLMWAGWSTEAVGYLNVPTSTFETTLTSTLSHVSKALSAASQFSMSIHKVDDDDFRLVNAFKDCVDLLELSSLQLSSALSSVQTGKSKTTKDLGSDLNTWLSAVSTNLETCKEGLEGFNVDTSIADHVSHVSSLAWRALDMVRISPKGEKRETPADDEFPTNWVRQKKAAASVPAPDVVVSLDGTGNFTRIMDAVEAAADNSPTRFVIHVKKGVYHENVLIGMKKRNLFMYGDGIDVTVVTGDRSVSKGYKTFQTATFGVMGQGFVARDMTFENTAGPNGSQAVAFRSLSDLSALYRCAFRGYQDTLYVHSNRQFYRECIITGTVDFIFGNGTAVFQQCDIRARPGLKQQKMVVTAQGRNDSRIASGFTIQNCNISGDSVGAGSTYLGRPWKEFSRTVVMESFIGPQVSKEGWLEWNGTLYLNTLYYAEYKNTGPSRAELGGRVKWPGYHLLTSSDQASQFTVSRFIQGVSWLPETGVPFDGGFVHPN